MTSILFIRANRPNQIQKCRNNSVFSFSCVLVKDLSLEFINSTVHTDVFFLVHV